MNRWNEWRAALRIARRDALRAKGRSLLVIAMIALPILGAVTADVTLRSGELSTEEALTREIGDADARLSDSGLGGPVMQEPTLRPEESLFGGNPELDTGIPDPDADPLPAHEVLPEADLVPDRILPWVPASTAHGRLDVDIREIDTTDSAVPGMMPLLRGSYPEGPGEVAATQAFLDSSGLQVGSQLTFPQIEGTYRVTGAYELPSELDSHQVLVAPDGLPVGLAEAGYGEPRTSYLARIDGGLGWDRITAINELGWMAASRAVLLDPPADEQVPFNRHTESWNSGEMTGEARMVLITVVSLVIVEICLLAGPAFAVGARRSRRMLGLVGANGGERRHIRAIMLSSGLVLGAAAAVVGTLLGLATTLIARPWLEQLSGQRLGSLTVRPWELLGISVLAVLIGVLAALFPAMTASRTPVLESLTGRRGVRRSSRVLPLVGGVVFTVGALLALVGAMVINSDIVVGIGAVLAQVGLVATTPFLVGLFGRIGPLLPLSGRLALRDAVRNRSRTAPAVAAVLAAVAGTVALATVITTDDAQQRAAYQADAPDGTVTLIGEEGSSMDGARDAAEQHLPTAERADLHRIVPGSKDCGAWDAEPGCGEFVIHVAPEHRCEPVEGYGPVEESDCSGLVAIGPTGTDQRVLIGDTSTLEVLGVADDASVAALERGEAVVFSEQYLDDGEVTIEFHAEWREDPGAVDDTGTDAPVAEPEAVLTLPAVAGGKQVDEWTTSGAAEILLPPSAVEETGLRTVEHATVYSTTQQPGEAEQQAFRAALDQLPAPPEETIEAGYQGEVEWILLVLALSAGLVTLGAAGIATGLAQADSEADLATLSAVGAPPGVRRKLSGLQCAVIAVMGVVLGTVSGVISGAGIAIGSYRQNLQLWNSQPDAGWPKPELIIGLPWEIIGVLMIAVPLLAGVVAMLLTRSKITLVQRRG